MKIKVRLYKRTHATFTARSKAKQLNSIKYYVFITSELEEITTTVMVYLLLKALVSNSFEFSLLNSTIFEDKTF